MQVFTERLVSVDRTYQIHEKCAFFSPEKCVTIPRCYKDVYDKFLSSHS